jgi:hypothetical protein
LRVGLTIQPCKKVTITKPQRGGWGPIWAVEPYDDDDESMEILNRVISTELEGYGT